MLLLGTNQLSLSTLACSIKCVTSPAEHANRILRGLEGYDALVTPRAQMPWSSMKAHAIQAFATNPKEVASTA